MMFLITWESEDSATSNVIKRTRPAADQVFADWVKGAIQDGGESQGVTLYVIDDENPDVTMHEVKYWTVLTGESHHPLPAQYNAYSPVGQQFPLDHAAV
jgi:hypothetical protein